MTNKEYKRARENAESASEIYTFEFYVDNGWGGYYNRYMKPEDIKEMRQDYKEEKRENKAFSLDSFNGRALIIPTESGYILKSYYTEVCKVVNGEFIKVWDGFSVTTLKHVNIFREFLGLDALNKREWIELEAA